MRDHFPSKNSYSGDSGHLRTSHLVFGQQNGEKIVSYDPCVVYTLITIFQKLVRRGLSSATNLLLCGLLCSSNANQIYMELGPDTFWDIHWLSKVTRFPFLCVSNAILALFSSPYTILVEGKIKSMRTRPANILRSWVCQALN